MGTILIVTNWLSREVLGGTEILAEAVARVLACRGHTVIHVGCSRCITSPTPIGCTSPNTFEVLLPLPFPVGNRRSWTRHAAAEHVRGELVRLNLRVDVLHFFHFTNLGLEFAELLGASNVVLTLTDYSVVCADFQYFKRGEKRICDEKTTENCGLCTGGDPAQIAATRTRNLKVIQERNWLITCQTPYQRHVLEEFGVSSEAFALDMGFYPYQTELRCRGPKPRAGDRRIKARFAYFGRDSVEKGVDVAVHAFRLLARNDVQFHAYVPDAQSSELRKMRCKNIFIHEPVSYPKVVTYMKMFDYVVIPSIWLENYPVVAAQAKQAGVGILASDLPSLRHLPDFANAQWAQPGNVREWTRLFRRVINKRMRMPEPKLNASRRVREFRRYIDVLERAYFQRDTFIFAPKLG